MKILSGLQTRMAVNIKCLDLGSVIKLSFTDTFIKIFDPQCKQSAVFKGQQFDYFDPEITPDQVQVLQADDGNPNHRMLMLYLNEECEVLFRDFSHEFSSVEEETISNLFNDHTLPCCNEISIMIPLSSLDNVELFENFFSADSDINSNK